MWTSADEYLERLFKEEERKESIVKKYENTNDEDIKTLIEIIKKQEEDIELEKSINNKYREEKRIEEKRASEYYIMYLSLKKLLKNKGCNIEKLIPYYIKDNKIELVNERL